MKITVFTPAYNRGYIVENLYRSLQRQTFKDFEWLVIDDGSTDNTSELFAAWKKEENFFPLHYEKVNNGGKHRAINRGVSLAKGELFFIVDSDDYLADNALERVNYWWNTVENKENFAGVVGLRGYSPEKMIGESFSNEQGFLDITALEREKYRVLGDKAEVIRTEIMKKFPFQEFEGENFLTEATVWNLIAAAGYKLRFFNEIIYLCNYLEDGLSRNLSQILEKNPLGKLYELRVFNETTHFPLKTRMYRFAKNGQIALERGYSLKKVSSILGCSPFFLKFSIFLVNWRARKRQKEEAE